MGCGASKNNQRDCDPDHIGLEHTATGLKNQNTHNGEHSKTVKEVDLLKDFKVTHTDFVTEKSGKIEQEYSLLSPVLREGAYGEVRKAIHKKTNLLRAVQIISKNQTDKNQQEKLMNEVNVLRQLDHPNIMKIIEFYQDNKAFYIVTEFYNGENLFDKITESKYLNEKQAALLMKQILSAVNHCHQSGIVHRNLNPEHILYESKRNDAPLKIIDFSTSRYYDSNTKMNEKLGTPYYIAPEVLKRNYTEKCDIWSCGVILYILLSGQPPFDGENDSKILDKVALGRYDFNHAEWIKVSDKAKQLIMKMMEYDPNQRYNAAQALNDPWFKAILGEATIDRPLAISALNNLKHFRAETKLQEAIWVFLVSFLTSNEEKNQLLSTFQFLNTNEDGKLSREELIVGYQKIMGLANAEAEVDAIMRALDNKGSRKIGYTEFIIATIDRQKVLSKERLETVFKFFDKDGKGYLNADDLREILNPGNTKQINEKLWQRLIQEANPDGLEKISNPEFKAILTFFYKHRLDDETKKQIHDIQTAEEYDKVELILLEAPFIKRYVYLYSCHVVSLLVTIIGNPLLMFMVLLVSLYIWYLYITASRTYYLKKPNKDHKKDMGNSEVWMDSNGEMKLVAWDKREDLELCFYYFNPLHVALLFCLSYSSKTPLFVAGILFLMVINVLMFMVFQDLLQRYQSDQKILQRELNDFYQDRMKVKKILFVKSFLQKAKRVTRED